MKKKKHNYGEIVSLFLEISLIVSDLFYIFLGIGNRAYHVISLIVLSISLICTIYSIKREKKTRCEDNTSAEENAKQ